MTIRASIKTANALRAEFKVPAGKSVTKDMRVKFSGADNQVEQCVAGDDGIGFAQQSVVGSAALPGVEVILEGFASIRCLVGTGGATRGLYAKSAVDGMTDQAMASGTTLRSVAGKFLQSGVPGDYVALMVGGTGPVFTA